MGEQELRTEEASVMDYKTGYIAVIGCQLAWGFLPMFWHALMPIDSAIIILYRILTMFIYCLIAAKFQYSWKRIFEPLKDKAIRRKYFTAGFILTINWSVYIWAINSGRVVQASIGYYIEPIVICLFGIVFFHEKITKYNAAAMFMALIAIAVILFHFRQLPGVALGLALTWATYSAIKKTAEQPPMISLVYETMLYAAIALVIIIVLECRGMGGLSYNVPGKYALMMLSGLVTCIPVGLFAVAAKKVSLFVIGLAQYISPTITLFIGIFIFREPIDKVQILAFVIVWIGLVFFTMGEVKNLKK